MGQLKFHFLNVGKGSCTIVQFPLGRVGVVDIDDSQSFSEEDEDDIAQLVNESTEYELTKRLQGGGAAAELLKEAYQIPLVDPVAYYKQNIGSNEPFRFILTHPHMDHMSGLKRFYDEIGMTNFWDTANDKKVDAASWKDSPYREEDWDAYQRLRKSKDAPRCIKPERGNLRDYWNEDKIEILSPSSDLVEKANDEEEWHHSSFVLRVSHAGWRVLLGGDASTEVWDDLLEDESTRDGLQSQILLAPHHGSKHFFHREAMEAVSPQLVIVSIHVGQDYAYDEYSRLPSKPKILATKWWGNVTVTIDDATGKCTYDTQFQR